MDAQAYGDERRERLMRRRSASADSTVPGSQSRGRTGFGHGDLTAARVHDGLSVLHSPSGDVR